MNHGADKPLRFGIPTLDRLLGTPTIRLAERSQDATNQKLTKEEPIYGVSLTTPYVPELDSWCPTEAPEEGRHTNEDSVTICIIGSDGVGKSVLALHMASQYRHDAHGSPNVLYASTDLSYGRALTTWSNFALDFPENRIADPFDYESFVERQKLPLDPKKYVPLVNHIPLSDSLPWQQNKEGHQPVVFIDLATYTTGDDWSYLNRVVASLEERSQSKDMLIVDAVEGLEVLVGDTDAFGQKRDRRSRVAQLLRSAARKCHIVLLVEESQSATRNPEEFVADAVIRLGSLRRDGYVQRVVEIEKVRGQTHVRGQHDITIRSGAGSSTGLRINPDDPRVPHPYHEMDVSASMQGVYPRDVLGNAATNDTARWQSYVYVFHSIHYLNRSIMEEIGESPHSDVKTLSGFGVEYIDTMLRPHEKLKELQRDLDETKLPERGDWRGLPTNEPTALIGEDGTYKSKLSKAFLARSFDPRERHASNKVEKGVSLLLTTKTLDSAGLADRIAQHLGQKTEEIPLENVFCRRLEVHHISPPILFHIIKRLVRRGQAELMRQRGDDQTHIDYDEAVRRSNGWRIRLVIDNWTAIVDTYPQVRDDPIFLPCLLFFLRREGISTIIVANEQRGFFGEGVLTQSRRLRDLTSIQLFTWRVPFFGESHVAITVSPPLRNDGRSSVIRELRMLGDNPDPTESDSGENEGLAKGPFQTRYNVLHVKPFDSRRIAASSNFELYDGLEKGVPEYVKLEIDIYAGTQMAAEYLEDVRRMAGRLLGSQQGNDVVKVADPINYQNLREFSELQGIARFPYTLVLQVDEYWAKSSKLQFRQQREYLFAETATQIVDGSELREFAYLAEDPFRVFQPSAVDKANIGRVPKTWRRADFFQTVGYRLDKLRENAPQHIVKVPYLWDFGFLMCLDDAWEASSENDVVKEVWSSLHRIELQGEGDRDNRRDAIGEVSWRRFAEAAKYVVDYCNGSSPTGNVGYIPFDVGPEVQETVACLLLEIWASEVQINHQAALARLTERVRKVDTLEQVLPLNRHDKESDIDLAALAKGFNRELIMALAILSDLLPPNAITDDYRLNRSDKDTRVPVAGRHWYSEACQMQRESRSANHIYMPAGLPGTFSVRGDWFLAVARGSRSYHMGDRAIDLMSSRRSNMIRLQTGVGLPVRDCHDVTAKELWTALWRFDRERRPSRRVTYQDLRSLGADGDPERVGRKVPFRWLWRSRIAGYDRNARIFRRWICFMLKHRDLFTRGASPLAFYDDMKVKQDLDSFHETFIDDLVSTLARARISADD